MPMTTHIKTADTLLATGTHARSAREIHGASEGDFTTARTTNLFLFEELEDISRTSKLADRDRDALRAVADWTRTFFARPHKDLGRAGPVCPFVPVALDHKTLAAERSARRSASNVIELVEAYKR